MKIIIPLIASASVCLVSCRESTTRMSSDEGASKEALQALEAKLADLENEILREKNERLEKEAGQRRLLLEIKEMVAEAKAPEEKSKTVVEKVTPAPVVLPVEEEEAPGVVPEKKAKAKDPHAEARKQARLNAEGEHYPSLRTLSGEEYRNLEITRVTDLGVIFRHSTGVARIPFTELPPAWRERFHYDPELTRLAEQNERETQTRLEAEMARQAQREMELAEKAAMVAQINQLQNAVNDLRMRDHQPIGFGLGNAFIGGGAFFNPPVVWPNQFGFWPNQFCAPIIQGPVIHPPVVRNPVGQFNPAIIRNRSPLGPVPRLDRPTLQKPILGNRTVQRPPTRVTGGGSSVSTPRIIKSNPSTSTPTVVRPSSSPRVIRPVTRSTRTSTSTPRTSVKTVRPSSSVRPTSSKSYSGGSSGRSSGRSGGVIRRTR